MKPEQLRAIEGTKDLLDLDLNRFNQALAAAAAVFGRYNYSQIITPVFEHTALFSRSIGEATDIVEKEMYTFTPGSDTITLRPEGTAGVVRAYLQHHLHKDPSLTKLWYAGPMFRRERPQKGRQRQFHQVGVEAIGSTDPLLDAEVIRVAHDYYQALGITGVTIKLNSIGCQSPSCRPAYRKVLQEALRPELPNLCKNCQNRFERNILRILDCKNPKCQEIRQRLPRSTDHLCEDCHSHQETVVATLSAIGIAFSIDPYIVRGLDYYTRTVFEFSHSALGSQDAIGAGGRYDGLVEELGGPATPAVGFAIGLERVLIAMAALDCPVKQPSLQVFGVAVEEDCRRALLGVLSDLRDSGISAEMDFEGRSMKAQMKKANRLGAPAVLILGSDELSAGELSLKDMRENGEQQRIALSEISAAVNRLLQMD